jgi:hypothetical protein
MIAKLPVLAEMRSNKSAFLPLATFRSDAKPCPILAQQPTSGGAMGSMGR